MKLNKQQELMREETMKEITVDQTKKIVFDYVSKLAKQHKLDPKKDIFNVVLPLENNQAISCYVGPNDDGERAVNYTVYGENYIMPKLKNTVLDLINDK